MTPSSGHPEARASLDPSGAKRARQECRLLQSVVLALGRTNDLASALALVLRNVCEVAGWAYGEAWLPDAEGLRLVRGPVWTSSARRLSAFAAASRRYEFRPGEGLPGRVWRSKTPLWIRDVRVDSNFPRARLASKAGLKGGFAVPVLGKQEVIAVLGFFVFEPRDEDDRLVKLVTTVAAQLGAVLQQRRAERALRLSRASLDAQELERGRLARELHDGVNQILSSVAFRLKVLEGHLVRSGFPDDGQAVRARTLLESAIDEVRRICRDLGPPLVEELGLVSSLRRLGVELGARTGATFRLLHRRFSARLTPAVASNVYRIVQEALANAEKHSQATRVWVRLARTSSAIVIRVGDNGRGFDALRAGRGGEASGHLGLRNMRERARLIRGRLKLRSNPGRGTELRLEIPLQPSSRAGSGSR